MGIGSRQCRVEAQPVRKPDRQTDSDAVIKMHAGNASGIGTPDPGAVASFVVTPSLLDIIVSYLCHCALQQSHTQTPSRGPPRRRREGHCKATDAEIGSVAIFLPAASSTLIAIPVKQAPDLDHGQQNREGRGARKRKQQ